MATYEPVVVIRGENGFLIYRVNGFDREIHIQSFLKMLNIHEDTITTIGKNKNWQKDFTKFFTKLGPPPSLVVYGFSETATLGLLLKHPIANLKFIPAAYNTLKPQKTPLTDQQSDLEGRPVQVITFANGKTIWLFKAMYGSLSADLMGALGSYGVKNILAIGTAGSLTSKLPVGTLFTPANINDENNHFVPIKILKPVEGIPVIGNYEKVDTPNIETVDWLNSSVAKGVETVEVELGHLISWAKQNPEVKLSSVLVISDILVGETHRDMTEWSSSDLTPLRDQLVSIISSFLKIKSTKELKFKDYKVFKFRGEN